jgi:hypothetical protein
MFRVHLHFRSALRFSILADFMSEHVQGVGFLCLAFAVISGACSSKTKEIELYLLTRLSKYSAEGGPFTTVLSVAVKSLLNLVILIDRVFLNWIVEVA